MRERHHATTIYRLIGVIAVFSISMLIPKTAGAPPAGYFFIQSIYQEADHSFGVLDGEDASHMVNGYVQLGGLTDPNNPGPTQQWEEIFSSTTDVTRMKNKATGQCLADIDDNDNSVRPTLKPCGNETTNWQKVPQGKGGIVFRRTQSITPPFSDLHFCLSRSLTLGYLAVEPCGDPDHYPEQMVFMATKDPVGVVSSGATVPPPPAIPPQTPTNCKLIGAAACGAVGFKCDPLSASDTIVVASGSIGVDVTAVQANLGLVVANYLNSGNAAVSVCATKSGAYSCSPRINVTFGNSYCPGAGGSTDHRCPTGKLYCNGACTTFGNPECSLH
jgi:hypothetical protein